MIRDEVVRTMNSQDKMNKKMCVKFYKLCDYNFNKLKISHHSFFVCC